MPGVAELQFVTVDESPPLPELVLVQLGGGVAAQVRHIAA